MAPDSKNTYTAREQFESHFEVLKKILHPDYAGQLSLLFSKCIDEIRQSEKDKQISPELQELGKIMDNLKRSAGIHGNHANIFNMYMKPIISKIKDTYWTPNLRGS